MKITDLTPLLPIEISLPEPAPATISPPAARKVKAAAPAVVIPAASEQVGALAIVEASEVTIIAAADKDGLLGKINARIAAFSPDLSAPDWQDVCRTLAYDIAKTKTALDKIGLGLTEDWRKSTKAVNEERNLITRRMDELKDAVRKPLTAWEHAEAARKGDHEDAISDIRARVDFDSDAPSAEEIRARLVFAEAVGNRDWQEYAEQAAQARADAVDRLRTMLAAAEKREAEQAQREAERAELERFRAERAARELAEAARIKAEQEAERIRKAAEAEVARALEAERARAAAEQERVEREAREAVERAERAEAARIEAIATAEREAREAEERAAQAEIRRQEEAAARERQIEADRIAAAEQAKRDAEAAVEAERRRVAEEAAREAAEAERRARSNRHKGKINTEALADLIERTGLDEAMGKKVIAAIARGDIRHTAISY